MKPLFIFSLPRSGSTLLQRMLAADDQISTVAEPWILLPFVYALREQGAVADYSHYWASVALNDFVSEFPNGKLDYYSIIREVVLKFYVKATKNKDSKYFLDKTPRYTLIADEVINMFPDGKFIFLWRNPLSVMSSIVETWGKGQWNLSMCQIDLYDGMENMLACYQSHSTNVLAIQYEELIRSPENVLLRIEEYLGLKLDRDVLNKFSEVSFSGKFGDPTGVKDYNSIELLPQEKWKATINTPMRKRWSRQYLNWLGEDRLAVMGYDLYELLSEMDSNPISIKKTCTEIVRLFYLRIRGIFRIKRGNS